MPTSLTTPDGKVEYIDAIAIRDALHNMAPNQSKHADYARGVLCGVVAGMMAMGCSFEEALRFCSHNAPKVIRAGTVPESWKLRFGLPESTNFTHKAWTRTEGL